MAVFFRLCSPFPTFVLPLIFVYLFAVYTPISLQHFVFLCGNSRLLWCLRGLQGQVLSGLAGMCWGVPLLIVTIFITLLGKFIAPRNRKTLQLKANYKKKIAWFTKELLPNAQLLYLYVEYCVFFFSPCEFFLLKFPDRITQGCLF